MIGIIYSVIISSILIVVLIGGSYYSIKLTTMKDEEQKDFVVKQKFIKTIQTQYFAIIGIFTVLFLILHFIF